MAEHLDFLLSFPPSGRGGVFTQPSTNNYALQSRSQDSALGHMKTAWWCEDWFQDTVEWRRGEGKIHSSNRVQSTSNLRTVIYSVKLRTGQNRAPRNSHCGCGPGPSQSFVRARAYAVAENPPVLLCQIRERGNTKISSAKWPHL